jgi:hypothetical protein
MRIKRIKTKAEDRNVAPYAIQAVPSDNENSG